MSITEVLESQDSWEKMILHVHPDDRDRYAKVDNSLPDTESLDVEYRIMRKDGEIRQVREISIVVTDEIRETSGAFGIFQDITEQNKNEKDLEYREALTQQAEAIWY